VLVWGSTYCAAKEQMSPCFHEEVGTILQRHTADCAKEGHANLI